jgi:hypothetical protein
MIISEATNARGTTQVIFGIAFLLQTLVRSVGEPPYRAAIPKAKSNHRAGPLRCRDRNGQEKTPGLTQFGLDHDKPSGERHGTGFCNL